MQNSRPPVPGEDLGETIIPLRRFRLVQILLLCVAFVAGGVWMILTADMDYSDDDPAYVRFIGAMMIVLFGVGFCLLVRASVYWRHGLVMNAEGVAYNAGIDGVGLVAWRDISGIEALNTPRMDFIRISLADPAKYVQRSNPLVRPLAWLNWKFYGSPVHMSVFFLDADRDTLIVVLEKYRARYGSV